MRLQDLLAMRAVMSTDDGGVPGADDAEIEAEPEPTPEAPSYVTAAQMEQFGAGILSEIRGLLPKAEVTPKAEDPLTQNPWLAMARDEIMKEVRPMLDEIRAPIQARASIEILQGLVPDATPAAIAEYLTDMTPHDVNYLATNAGAKGLRKMFVDALAPKAEKQAPRSSHGNAPDGPQVSAEQESEWRMFHAKLGEHMEVPSYNEWRKGKIAKMAGKN